MFLISQTSWKTWIIWMMFNVLFPTYIFAFVLTIVMPNIAAFSWGFILLFTVPPLGIIFLFYVAIYGFIFWIVSLICSLLIDQLPYVYLKFLALIIIFIILLKPTFLPIYGSGSAFGEGQVSGRTLWQWYKIANAN